MLRRCQHQQQQPRSAGLQQQQRAPVVSGSSAGRLGLTQRIGTRCSSAGCAGPCSSSSIGSEQASTSSATSSSSSSVGELSSHHPRAAAPQQLAAKALVASMRKCARSASEWMRKHRVQQLLFGDAAALAPLSAAGAPLASAAAVVLPALAGGGVSDLFTNRVFLAGFWAWFCAQTLKIFTKRLKKGVWDVRAIVDSGGMPSSHSALCAGVTTAIAFQPGLGFGSAAFAVAVAFSAIVMYDAAGVRRHAGKQAEVLNQVVDELLDGHPVSDVKLKEVLGHTPLQVCAGAVLGVLFGAFFPVPQPGL